MGLSLENMILQVLVSLAFPLAAFASAEFTGPPVLNSITQIEAAKRDSHYQYRNPFKDRQFPKKLDPKKYRPPSTLLELNKDNTAGALWPGISLRDLMSPDKGRFGYFKAAALERLGQLYERLGGSLTITSAYRSPGYNRSIPGSATWSRHQYGDALDFSSSVASIGELMKHCEQLAGIAIRYQTHVHCDWRDLPDMTDDQDLSVHRLRADQTRNLLAESASVRTQILADTWVLSVDSDVLNEDVEDQMFYSWSALSSDGTRVTSLLPTLVLPRSGEVIWDVTVNVGDILQLQEKLTDKR